MALWHIAGYRFVNIADCEAVRQALRGQCEQLGILGTILISSEGINQFLAGEKHALEAYRAFLDQDSRFAGIEFRLTPADTRPYAKLEVKVKPEIITTRDDSLKPEEKTGPYLAPQELKTLLDQHENLVLLDTRNAHEVEVGTFDGAEHLAIDKFTDFAEAIAKLPDSYKDKTIVTFCTGGIRCEKATLMMMQQGFEHVFQLEGGILNYFEQCGGAHYHGNCFVFDNRIALNPQLEQPDCNE